MRKWIALSGLFVNLMLASAAAAFEDIKSDEELFFMDIPVSVAARTTQNSSEAPAVLTIITAEEIQNSGARELSDILSMVPGFAPAKEVEGFLGYGVRGIWSLEGKMLVMIDGVQVNETLYGNPIFGASSFVDYIDRIEIIRGPGSALYGGFGELAVINIITKNQDTPGTTISAMCGQMAGTFGHRSFNINHASRINDARVSISAAVGDGHLSDRDFINIDDMSFPMKDFGGNKSWFAKIAIDDKDLNIQAIGNYYAVQSIMSGAFNNTTGVYGPSQDMPLEASFASYSLDSKYKFRLGDSLSVTPRITYTEFDPWRAEGDEALQLDYYFYYPSRQAKLNISSEYDITDKTNLVVGAEYRADTAYAKGLSLPFADGEREVNYNTQSFFGEFLSKTGIGNITLGARYDKQNHFGGAFSPRFALTKAIGKFNLKGLVSQAYRAPSILNIDYNPDIKPEYTSTAEAEAGYMVTRDMSLVLNVFDTRVKDVIFYSATDVTYYNFGKTGSRGFDLSCQLRKRWGYMNISYSFYKAVDNEVPDYAAVEPDGRINSDVILGFPAQKASLTANYNINSNLSINPSVLYYGQRYNTYWSNAAGGNVNQVLDPVTLVNINVRIMAILEDTELAIGAYNIFDAPYSMAPGYYDLDRPTPSYSREYTLKLTYNF